MIWYRWKCWRLAYAPHRGGYVEVLEGPFRWAHLGGGFFWRTRLIPDVPVEIE